MAYIYKYIHKVIFICEQSVNSYPWVLTFYLIYGIIQTEVKRTGQSFYLKPPSLNLGGLLFYKILLRRMIR